MTKLWRLLMASTVLSGLAGLGAAQAANDLALPAKDNAAQASIILAQAATPEEDAARRRQQQQNQQQRQNNQQQRQNQRQDGQQQRQNQRQDGQQQRQNQRQDNQNPATNQASPPPPATRASPPPPPPPPPAANRASPPPPAGSSNTPATGRQDGGVNRNATSPASPPPAATAPRGNQNRDAGGNQNQGRDRNVNQNQGRDRDPNNRNQSTTTPPGGNNRGGVADQSDDKSKPIPSAGAGKGVAVKSSSGQEIRRVDEIKSERRETKEGGRTVIYEPGRTIIKDVNNKTIIRHDETARFRLGATNVRIERVGNDSRTVIFRPGGERIVTVTDRNGFLLRRIRVLPNGREIILINNRPRVGTFFVILPPPRILIPRERYIVAYRQATPAIIYETLMAPPVEVIERAYTLDEIRYSAPVRDRMPRIDLDDITFETGSWELSPEQIDKLAAIAEGMKRAIDRNPRAVFLIEGHTDAVGNDDDNLSLSDRRAESVAVALTEQFQVPAENLTTQGYGEQQLKVPTDGPEEQNRRVTVRNIAPLLAGRGDAPPAGEPTPR